MDIIKIYTDWSCLWNPWPWWYAAILLYRDNSKNIVWGELETTNNRMELMAVIKALQSIKNKNIPIEIYVDSKYVSDWISKYLPNWINNWWKLSNKQDVKNKDLWIELHSLTKWIKNINWNWVKAHSVDLMNNLVDKLARDEATKLKEQQNS